MLAERAAGNPFFAEEMVRELGQRGVLRGNRGAYVSTADVGEVSVPSRCRRPSPRALIACTRKPSGR